MSAEAPSNYNCCFQELLQLLIVGCCHLLDVGCCPVRLVRGAPGAPASSRVLFLLLLLFLCFVFFVISFLFSVFCCCFFGGFPGAPGNRKSLQSLRPLHACQQKQNPTLQSLLLLHACQQKHRPKRKVSVLCIIALFTLCLGCRTVFRTLILFELHTFADGHIKLNTPDLFRLPKLSSLELG